MTKSTFFALLLMFSASAASENIPSRPDEPHVGEIANAKDIIDGDHAVPAQNAVSLDVKKTQAMMPQGAADQKTLLEILIGAANVFVAIVVGGIAYYAQQAANRDSVTGLLDYVSAAREKAVEEYVVWYKQTHAPDFNTVPENIKKDMIEMLDNAHRTKRGLDFARHKLLIKADKAWGLGDSLQRGMSGLNPAADRDHDELVQALKDKYLKESDVSRNEPGGILDKS